MFRFENNVPEVYVTESRDFQLLTRLYDLPFQQVRQATKSMELITDTKHCNESLLPLLGTKLGFFEELNVSSDIYRSVLSAFPLINQYKGTQKAIELVICLFQKIVNTNITYTLSDNRATIKFDTYCSSTDLLETLLDYVRPCGYIITWIVAASNVNQDNGVIYQSDSYSVGNVYDSNHISNITRHTSTTKPSAVGKTFVNSSDRSGAQHD